jgi:hypothetical protein
VAYALPIGKPFADSFSGTINLQILLRIIPRKRKKNKENYTVGS